MFNRLFANLFPAQPDNVRVVDPAEVRRWYEAGEVVLVDVREANEFAAEHIPGAHHLPLSAFDPGRVPATAGRRLVIHCRSGQRCGMAAARLAASGYQGEILRMQGGLMGWKSAGGPTRPGG